MMGRKVNEIKLLCFSLFVGLSLVLSGCSVSEPVAQKPTIKQQRESYLHELASAGVSVQKVGQKVSLVMSTDTLFNVDSANFKSNTSRIMGLLARYMNSYRLVAVKVSVYGDNRKLAEQRKLLTTAQAEKIGEALVEENLDFRLVYTVGYGDKKAITENKTFRQQAENRRAVVSFQFYPEQSAN